MNFVETDARVCVHRRGVRSCRCETVSAFRPVDAIWNGDCLRRPWPRGGQLRPPRGVRRHLQLKPKRVLRLIEAIHAVQTVVDDLASVLVKNEEQLRHLFNDS